jgi:hypothetical protein
VRCDAGVDATSVATPVSATCFGQLKDIEGMSRSEIVEGAIIRLARRRCIDQSVQDTQRKRVTLTAVLDLRAKISGCQGIFS